ncbi:MAG: hypothetical protein HC768_10875 [Acaryochloris sp. CRU_2_0]|nr:hypothetical protein [Acaryochloris sp. CRU_2_0]
MLEHFGRSPGTPFEVEELALQFSSSEAHLRRLVKRLWRQGHILEETRQVPIAGSKGGMTRKKFTCVTRLTMIKCFKPSHSKAKKHLIAIWFKMVKCIKARQGKEKKHLIIPFVTQALHLLEHRCLSKWGTGWKS